MNTTKSNTPGANAKKTAPFFNKESGQEFFQSGRQDSSFFSGVMTPLTPVTGTIPLLKKSIFESNAEPLEEKTGIRRSMYDPENPGGKGLLARRPTQVIHYQRGEIISRYGPDIPDVNKIATVKTMGEFIDLVKRIEAAHAGVSSLEIAKMIMRTKYNSSGFDWLLPSSAKLGGVSAGGGVTGPDVTTLGGEFDVQLPQGGKADPSHIMVAIVAKAESQAPGSGQGWLSPGNLVSGLPSGLTQSNVATWTGDVASAAAEWMTAHPLPKGGGTEQDYMDEFAPESDLIGDIDGLAMTSTSGEFIFDFTLPLSENMEKFYFPANAKKGKNRRFHIFCSVEGFGLAPDGITLSGPTIAQINEKVQKNADWFAKNDPNLTTWMALNTDVSNSLKWMARKNDWQWFAKKFTDFLQRNLIAEGS
jgi:hypothetical protein